MAKLSEYPAVGDAADLLGVSKDTLRRWDRAGKLKARRHPITGYRLYLRSELDALLRGTLSADGGQPPKRAKNKVKRSG